MHPSVKDIGSVGQVGWPWTAIAMLATVVLVVLATLALPVVFVMTQLSLPRGVKPLRDA